MNRLLSLVVLLAGTLSLRAGDDVVLHFNHQLDGEALVYNQAVTGDSYEWWVGRMEYYMGEIEIIHDGGLVTPVPDTYLLINAGEDITFALGNFDVTVIEGLRFHIGIPEPLNHLDPGSYPSDDPLAYQSPAMHWGWAAGYRFVCMEGKAGTSPFNTWEIHGLGDDNYNEVSLTGSAIAEGGTQTYYIDANYAEALTNTDVSAGMIEHSETGIAASFLDDFAALVFSRGDGAQVVSSIGALDALLEATILGNPAAAGNSTFRYRLSAEGQYDLAVYNALGATLFTTTLAGQEGQVALPTLAPGTYLVRIANAAGQAHTLRWVVR